MNNPYGYSEHNYYGDNYYEGYGTPRGYGSSYYPHPNTEQHTFIQGEEEPPIAGDSYALFSYRPDPEDSSVTGLSLQQRRRSDFNPEEDEPLISLKKTFIWFTTGTVGFFSALTVIIASVILFIWPGVFRVKHLDPILTNSDIRNIIEKTFGWSGISSVDCHVAHIIVRKGNTFDCTVNTVNNTNITISAIFVDNQGKYEVEKPRFNR